MEKFVNCSSWRLLVLMVLCVTTAACWTSKGDKAMTDMFYESSLDRPVKLDVVPVVIQQVDGSATLPKAYPLGDGAGCPRPFVNDQLNSRLTRPLPKGAWKVCWHTELESEFRPTFVLQAGDRILVQGSGRWQLFNMEGGSLAMGHLGASDVGLDAVHSLFYLADPDGFITGRRLSDGREAFAMSAYFGDDFRRALLARRGRRMIVVSVERPMDPHGHHKPNFSVIEVQDMGDPPQVDNNGFLTSTKRLANLMRRTILLMAALQDDTLVIATQDHVYLADYNLRIRSDLERKFVPLTMSLDEAGRIYLVVRVEGQNSLWLLTPKGERLMSFALPADFENFMAPPIVGYDHRVYLAAANRLIATSPEGKLVREHAIGLLGGAVVTADDQLVVSAGSDLAAFDAEGKRSLLYRFDDDGLRTPPVLTEAGRFLVASQRYLYCLAPQPQ